MTYITNGLVFRSGEATGLGGWLARQRNAIRNWIAYRRTVSELAGLSDEMLKDMGISRERIETVARKAVYGR
jgi:uncharacterized protein YjiS (DUF1127 family)